MLQSRSHTEDSVLEASAGIMIIPCMNRSRNRNKGDKAGKTRSNADQVPMAQPEIPEIPTSY